MARLSERSEIAEIEWRRVTSIAWPTLSVIFAAQALHSEIPIQSWQILYVSGLILSGLLSWVISRVTTWKFSSTPIVIYLLVSPIFLGDQPDKSWMSIGLAAFGAVIYFSTIEYLPLAIVVVLLITTFQTYVAHLNLSSVSDNFDIAYFHSYFSILWISVMGIASIFIRRQYLEVANSIQETVDEEIDSSLTKLKGLKQINEKDSRNLRLHGTVLNTLIHIRNLIEQKLPSQQAISTLIAEVKSLSFENITINKAGFLEKVESMIANRALKRIDVSISPFDGRINSQLIEELCLEIVRELILNTEKHTRATTAAIEFVIRNEDEIQIIFIENSISKISPSEKKIFLDKPKESQTLQKLLQACGATINISFSKGKRFRKVDISIPQINLELELKSTLAKSRITGLNDFSLNYVRASALVGILSLPGYLLAGLNPITLLLTSLTVLGFFLVLQFPRSRPILYLLLISSLLIVPSISYKVSACSELGTIPWLFNHILTVGFFASIYFKNRVLKWLPLSILTAECFYFPLSYPAQCGNILLGSLPGIPLIIVLALSVLYVRKREVYFDESESLEVARLARVVTSTDEYREGAYTALLQDLTRFANSLEEQSGKTLNVDSFLLQIQKIQTFLICAEHFDSELVRKTFELFREKQMQNIPGRLVLLGENFLLLDQGHSIDKIVREIKSFKADSPTTLTIMNVHTAEFHFDGANSSKIPDSIDGIPVFINQ